MTIEDKDILTTPVGEKGNLTIDNFFSPAERNNRNYATGSVGYGTMYNIFNGVEFNEVVSDTDITELHQTPDRSADLRNSLNSSISAMDCLRARIEALEALLLANGIDLQEAEDRIDELTRLSLEQQLNVDDLSAYSSSLARISGATTELYQYINSELKPLLEAKTLINANIPAVNSALDTYLKQYDALVGPKALDFLELRNLKSNATEVVTHAKTIGRRGVTTSINTEITTMVRDDVQITDFDSKTTSEKIVLYNTSFFIRYMQANNSVCSKAYLTILGTIAGLDPVTQVSAINQAYAAAAAVMEIYGFTHNRFRELMSLDGFRLPEITYVNIAVRCDECPPTDAEGDVIVINPVGDDIPDPDLSDGPELPADETDRFVDLVKLKPIVEAVGGSDDILPPGDVSNDEPEDSRPDRTDTTTTTDTTPDVVVVPPPSVDLTELVFTRPVIDSVIPTTTRTIVPVATITTGSADTVTKPIPIVKTTPTKTTINKSNLR